MRAANTVTAISEKLRETADGASERLMAAGETIDQGLRETTGAAAERVRHSAGSAATAMQDAAAAVTELYKDGVSRASNSLAGMDRIVSRNPAGALIAALGMGLVLGFLARR